MLRLRFEDGDKLDDPAFLGEFLVELVNAIGMRILSGPLTGVEGGEPDRCGCSGVIILYESHAAMHTYPKLGEAFLDVFSCKPYEESRVHEVLQDWFGPFQAIEQTKLDRGVHWDQSVEQHLSAWQATR